MDIKKVIAFIVILLFISLNFNTSTLGGMTEINVSTDNDILKTYNNLEYWALIVGVGIYAGHPEKNTSAHLSAEAIYDSLLSSEHWQEDHIKLITCENATKTNIINGLQWLDSMEDEDDVSLLYIATHGGQMELFGKPFDFPPFDEADRCDEILATYYSYEKPLFTYIRDDELRFFIDRLECQGICVIIDSCHAGGFNDTFRKTSSIRDIVASEYDIDYFSPSAFIEGFSEEIKKDGRVIMMSSQEDEPSYSDLEEGHVFTSELVKSLGEGFGDLNNNGLISAEEVFNYTRYRTPKPSTPQHPIIYDGYDGELDLTFSRYIVDFFDDFESSNGWTSIDHTGGVAGDLWHLSELDHLSPTQCWYFGDENTMRYNNNMNNSLLSPEIKLGKNPLLTFFKNGLLEIADALWLEISTDNWSTYYTLYLSVRDYWYNPAEISLYSHPFGDLSGKTIQLRFRLESDESIPFDLRYGIGNLMIDDITIFSERSGK